MSWRNGLRCLCLAMLFASCENGSQSQREEEIQAIEVEIQLLQDRLDELNEKTFDEMMESQEQMLADWKGFSESIQEAEDTKARAVALKQLIDSLQERKDRLVQAQKQEEHENGS